MLSAFLKANHLDETFEVNAQKWFIPMADTLALHSNGASGPVMLGLNGCQGSGKSTLASFLYDYLTEQHQLNVCCLSLDDFYYSHSHRLDLSVKVHPLFQVRGVPGTHDTSVMKSVLASLKEGSGEVIVPRFNKATDDPFPPEKWSKISLPVDVVIFEGWCWGVDHQPKSALVDPVNALEKEEDELGVWRSQVNEQLRLCYEPLYAYMDYWCMFKAPSFQVVHQWRTEQEARLAASLQGQDTTRLMNEQQIKRFVSYYQRLTEYGLETLPNKCDWIFCLDEKRHIVS